MANPFPVWKSVKTGTHKTRGSLVEALKQQRVKISGWAAEIIPKVSMARVPKDRALVLVSVAELGFPNGATRAEIYKKALSLGLRICPAEVGLQLRRQYTDQVGGEWPKIAMKPIASAGGSSRFFSMSCSNGDLSLDAYNDHADLCYEAPRLWVFLQK